MSQTIDLARVRAGDEHADRAAALGGADPERAAAWLAQGCPMTEQQLVIRMPGPLLARLDAYVEALRADPERAAAVLGAGAVAVNRSAVVRALVDLGIDGALHIHGKRRL
jgi:hypothetical protein